MVKEGGKEPIVKFTEDICDFGDESFDPGMIGKIVGATKESENTYQFRVDLNDYVEHNKSVASNDWIDGNGKPTLTWFETKFYPQDGIEVMYLPIDREAPVEFIEKNSLFNEFITSNSKMNYTQWLEQELINLRKHRTLS